MPWDLPKAKTRRRVGYPTEGSDRRGVFHRSLQCELLEDRRLLSVGGVGTSDVVLPGHIAVLPPNIESNLAAYYAAARPVLQTATNSAELATTASARPDLSIDSQSSLFQFDQAGHPLVDVWTTGPTAPVVSQLGALGGAVVSTNDRYHLVEAWLNVADLPAVASMSGVLSLAPVYRPIAFAGSVQTQGDAVIHADAVRDPQLFPPNGYDGSPSLIGVISDSTWYLTQSQATGDLPQIVDRHGDLLTRSGSDEGRAMLEIVHDVAPGARLAFSPGVISESFFADGIRKLASAGAKVIVDDLTWPAEPFFQDGIVAQAVDEVANSGGVTYVSAAGNSSTHSYEHLFVDANPGDPGNDYHDFDSGAGVDTRQRISVPRGYYTTLILQWDDPFYTTSGVTHDFDVRVYDTDGVLVDGSTNNNIATQRPVEVVTLAPPAIQGSEFAQYDVEIRRVAGTGPSLLKYVIRSSGDAATIDEYATDSGTIYGHAAAAGAIAVGAVPYNTPNQIEPFSSQGDVTIYFDAQGNRLATPEVRHKPDVVGPDKVATSLSGFQSFSGTSAAAPHVAGAAGLLLDANPHLTRAEVYNLLTSTATDLGSPGRDSVFGYGLVNAQAAVTAALVQSDVTSPSAQMTSPGTLSGWHVPFIDVQFSEPMNSAGAANVGNYGLVEAGPDGVFGSGDDVSYTVTASYSDDARETRLTFAAPSTALSDGNYRLTLKASGGLADPAGNPLNNGINEVFPFTVAFKGSINPLEDAMDTSLTGGMDVRPDGRAVMVYSWLTGQVAYPGSDNISRPELMVGQYDANAQSEGPYRYLSPYPTFPLGANSIHAADVAVNATKGVVVYEIENNIHADYHAAFQLIDNDGHPIGVCTQIDAENNTAPGFEPRVAINDSGSFVVVYKEKFVGQSSDSIRARFYDANGNPTSAAFVVESDAFGDAEPVVVALSNNGTAVITYKGGNNLIRARLFDSAGSALGDISIVTTAQFVFAPAVAMAADGSFVVAWYGVNSGSSPTGGIFFRRFDSSGSPLGAETVIVTHAGSSDYFDMPQVAMAPDGRFAVVWGQRDANGHDLHFVAKRFTANGSVYGDPIWVNEGMTGFLQHAKAGMADNGNFLVTWGITVGTFQNQIEKRYSRSFSWEGTDQPSFTAVDPPAVNEDASQQILSGWATIDASLDSSAVFAVSNISNPTLFSSPPSITPDGQLLYTPAPAAFGTSTLQVTIGDAYGTYVSPPRTFTITVNPVNDRPSFTKGPNQIAGTGAQTVPDWATAISGGPPNESGQQLNFVVNSSDPSLFAAAPAISPSGVLTFTPAVGIAGTATMTVTLHDDGGTANSGQDTSFAQTFTITVNTFNLQPSFTKGADQTVNEDAGAQAVAGWATAISAGPPNESNQQLNFIVNGTNLGLFSVPPAISPSGTLTYTPAAHAFGTSTVTVTLHDDGGTANGGQDTSAAQTFTITINPVNDVPSFTKGGDPTVNEDAGAQTVAGWATAISAGPPNESNQQLNFIVNGTNLGLFSVAPAISPSGTLTYTPAPHAFGTSTVTVSLHDDGGTANGGQDTSAPQTFTITVNPVNDSPSFAKGSDQMVLEDAGAQTVVGWATAISPGPVNENGQALNFLVTSNNTALFSVQPSIAANGTLTYTPATNANGIATVSVALHDNGGTANGGVDTSATKTFTITVNGVNDSPSFTKGSDSTINEDAGAQTVAGWATAISAGPPNESSQQLNFQLSSTNASLFSVAPAISPSGTLTYTPAAHAFGTSTVTVTLHDDGGTANGSQDTSAAQTFTITINPVNDVPSFTKGGDPTVNEDAGAQTVAGWATAISAGPPNESNQQLNFIVNSTNPSLFSVAPAISPSGTLTYTPAAQAFGTSTVTVTLHDDGGTANGGQDTSAAQSFTITIINVHPWHNHLQGLDVDANGLIQTHDALLVINWLLRNGLGELPAPNAQRNPPPYVDTTGNNSMESRDALLVINWLLRKNLGGTVNADPVAEPMSAGTLPLADGSQHRDVPESSFNDVLATNVDGFDPDGKATLTDPLHALSHTAVGASQGSGIDGARPFATKSSPDALPQVWLAATQRRLRPWPQRPATAPWIFE